MRLASARGRRPPAASSSRAPRLFLRNLHVAAFFARPRRKLRANLARIFCMLYAIFCISSRFPTHHLRRGASNRWLNSRCSLRRSPPSITLRCRRLADARPSLGGSEIAARRRRRRPRRRRRRRRGSARAAKVEEARRRRRGGGGGGAKAAAAKAAAEAAAAAAAAAEAEALASSTFVEERPLVGAARGARRRCAARGGRRRRALRRREARRPVAPPLPAQPEEGRGEGGEGGRRRLRAEEQPDGRARRRSSSSSGAQRPLEEHRFIRKGFETYIAPGGMRFVPPTRRAARSRRVDGAVRLQRGDAHDARRVHQHQPR